MDGPLDKLLTDLAKELAETLKQTKGGLGLLPKTIANVLNSQACRGTLKFKYCKKVTKFENISTCFLKISRFFTIL